MKKTVLRCSAGLGICSLLLARAAFAGPSDIVPRGDIAYDLLGSLAASGRVPGLTLADLFRGDRLYTRAEMAEIVRRTASGSGLSAADATALRILEKEFEPELRGAPAKLLPPSGVGRITGDVKLRALSGPAALDGIGRASVVLPAGSSGYAAIGLGNWRDEWYDRNAPLHGYPLVETVYIRENTRFLDFAVGRLPLRWGPGYSGTLLLSDEAPSIPQIRVEKTFLPGGWFHHVGPLHFEQFDGQFFEPDDPTAPSNARGTRRYLLGRRLETAGAGRWSLSLAETLKSTQLPSPFAANILPFYLYQNEAAEHARHQFLGWLVPHSEPNTLWKNYLADISTAYRFGAGRGLSVYDDFLLDDVKAPNGIGLPGPVTRKLGDLVGVYASDLLGDGGRVGARLEYATIDPQTYTNASPPVNYTEEDVSLGYPAGPNANVFFGRLDVAASSRIKLAVEGATRRRKDSTTPGPDSNRVAAYATYALRRDTFVGLRFEHLHVDGDSAASHNRAEVNVGAGF